MTSRKRVKVSEGQRYALAWLSMRMWTTPELLGTALRERGLSQGINDTAIGASLLRELRKSGWAYKLKDLGGLWRITPAGRRALEGK